MYPLAQLGRIVFLLQFLNEENAEILLPRALGSDRRGQVVGGRGGAASGVDITESGDEAGAGVFEEAAKNHGSVGEGL